MVCLRFALATRVESLFLEGGPLGSQLKAWDIYQGPYTFEFQRLEYNLFETEVMSHLFASLTTLSCFPQPLSDLCSFFLS